MKQMFHNIVCMLTVVMFISILLSGCGGLSAIGKTDSNLISTNYALASNGGKVIVSKEDPRHSGSTLNNGVISSDLWDNGEGWECFFKGQLMDAATSRFRNGESKLNNTTMGWVVIEFPEPKLIHQAVIYTLNSKKYPAYKYGVRNIYVQFQVKDNDPWFLVERLGKSITDRADKIYGNKAGIIDYKFKPRLAKRIRIAVEETNDLKQLSGWGGGSYLDTVDWFSYQARVIEGTIRLVEIAVYGTKNANIQNKRLSNVEKPEGEINSTNIKGEDGAEMLLIPAGEFQMGSNDGNPDEKPVHTVYLDAFYMDVYEVTNAQYKKFMDETGYKAPSYWNEPNYNAPNNPVVGVSWNDANAYANWAGKRLPTEEEFEKAAGGLTDKKYPYGDSITHDNANYSGTGVRDKWEYLSPVGSFAPNGYGLYDVIGNAWEWCSDWYDGNHYTNSLKSSPTGPSSEQWWVLRGGSWSYRIGGMATGGSSLSPTYVNCLIGFRCVQDVPK